CNSAILHIYYRSAILVLHLQFVLVSVALGFLILSTALPWLIVNLFGQRTYSALDNLTIIITTASPMSTDALEKSQIDPIISDLNSWIYSNSSFALIVGTILYPISLATMAIALVLIVLRNKVTSYWTHQTVVAAGILAIVAAAFWIYSIQSFKIQFSQEAELSGGIIGEEWRGSVERVLDRLIVIGSGPFVVAAGGIIAIFAFFIERTYIKREKQNSATQPES
ncbi:MAG: hypothetical protein ACREAS_09735, partial [Nitrososphaera sp.]